MECAASVDYLLRFCSQERGKRRGAQGVWKCEKECPPPPPVFLDVCKGPFLFVVGKK